MKMGKGEGGEGGMRASRNVCTWRGWSMSASRRVCKGGGGE